MARPRVEIPPSVRLFYYAIISRLSLLVYVIFTLLLYKKSFNSSFFLKHLCITYINVNFVGSGPRHCESRSGAFFRVLGGAAGLTRPASGRRNVFLSQLEGWVFGRRTGVFGFVLARQDFVGSSLRFGRLAYWV